jgi:TatA/E family protein of Tat protein translocase
MIVEQMLAIGMPGHFEIGVICVIVVLIFGRSLPKIARNLGQSLVELRKGFKEYRDLGDEMDKNEKEIS